MKLHETKRSCTFPIHAKDIWISPPHPALLILLFPTTHPLYITLRLSKQIKQALDIPRTHRDGTSEPNSLIFSFFTQLELSLPQTVDSITPRFVFPPRVKVQVLLNPSILREIQRVTWTCVENFREKRKIKKSDKNEWKSKVTEELKKLNNMLNLDDYSS